MAFAKVLFGAAFCVMAAAFVAVPVEAQQNTILVEMQLLYDDCKENANGSSCFRYQTMRQQYPRLAGIVERPEVPAQEEQIEEIRTLTETLDQGSDFPYTLFFVIAIPLLAWVIYDADKRRKAMDSAIEIPKPTPVLKTPPIRSGPRMVSGELWQNKPDDQILVPWNRDAQVVWLTSEEKRLRARIEDKKLLTLADDRTLASTDEDSNYVLALQMYAREKHFDEETQAFDWNDEMHFALIVSALAGVPSCATEIAMHLWQDPQSDSRMIYGLLRMDADKDFSGAAVEMQRLINSRRLLGAYFYDEAVAEAYLRHHFDIGAPQTHFVLATKMAGFYLSNAPYRPDDGYLAAAIERIEPYDKALAGDLRAQAQQSPIRRNLLSKTISRNGLMTEQMQMQQQGPLQ